MSRIQRGSGTPDDDNDLTWWQITQNLLAGRDWDDSGGGLTLTPEDFQRMYMDDLKDSTSASYINSSLAQKYGVDDITFYRVDNDGKLVNVKNNNIQIIIRKYNDNEIGVVFYDYQTRSIVQPRGLDLGENITPSDRQIGEYTVAPPKTNLRPGDLAYTRNFNAYNVIQYFENNTTIDTTPPPPEPGPDEPTTETINFNRDNYNIEFRIMLGNSSLIYNGQVFIKETRYEDGSIGFNFINDNGDILSSNLPQSGPNSLWDGTKGQFILQPGGGSVIDYLDANYGKQPEPEPPTPEPPAPGTYDADTEEYDLLFTKSDGSRYRGQVNIIYQFDAGEWKFRVVKAGTNQPLTIEGSNINEIGRTDDGPLYSLPYEDGLSFGASFDSTYEGIPPEPIPDPGPEPGPDRPPTPEPGPDGPTGSATDAPLSRINVNDHPGLIFRESISGERIEDDDIEIFSLGDLDSDGKTEIYFRTSDGRELTIEQAQGYHYKDYPEDDTQPTGARRLAEGRTLYQMSGTNETIANAFSSGFGASKNIDLQEKSLLERLPIKGFVVYNKSNKKHFTIKNKDSLLNGLQIIGIMKHNIGKKSEFIPLTAEHNELGQKKMIDEGTTGAGELTGSFTSSGGERPREEFDLMSAPDLCGGGGSGRRLMQCGPDEPAPEFNEFKHEVSESELLNFERNRETMEKEKDPQYSSLTLYERMRDTTSEEELISMYATFSGVAYLEKDKRPDIFGLDYLEDESSNNLAVYKGRANKNIVISYRGTKPTNGIDLLSDALILTGYEKQASLRFENALREAERLLDKYPDANILFTGHSLGGALAEFVIDEIKGNSKYRNRNIKSIVFNPGKSPNTRTERADKIAETLNEVSLVKAIKTGNPEYLPILNNIQSRLGISVNDITNPEIMTSRDELQSILSNYPELSSSFNGLSSRMSATQTLAEREALAVEWIEANRALLPQTIDYIGSLGNLIKTKLYFDMILKVFDFSANYTIDQVLKEESDLDKRISKSKKPYDELFKDSDNVIFRYSRDPISLQHSFLEDDKKNVRTYHEGNTSLLFDGLEGTIGEGLKQHGIDNFILKKHKGYLNKDESWLEYFSNIFNDNVESTGEILTGLKYKLNDLEKQYIEDNGWLSFLGL